MLINKEIPAPKNQTMADQSVRDSVIAWNRSQNAEYRKHCKLEAIATIRSV